MFERIRNEIVEDLQKKSSAGGYDLPEERAKYVERMINYTAKDGKMTRGLSVMQVQGKMAEFQGRKLSDKERMQSAALGWCIEFLQAFFLVADDIMDDSKTRRDKPCWYLLEDVKKVAINDSFILESCVYKILKRYFGAETYYLELVELFIEVTRQTEIGQLLDLTAVNQQSGGPIDLDYYTDERYFRCVTYKTAYYSFYLPVALGLTISGIKERKVYDESRDILLKMGQMFQVQDDFLDCYGLPEKIGKIGTDIQDNKCGWLICQAVKPNCANAEQRNILRDNYAKHDDECIQRVKDLYKVLKIETLFHNYEEATYAELNQQISKVTAVPKGVYTFLLDKIYHREK